MLETSVLLSTEDPRAHRLCPLPRPPPPFLLPYFRSQEVSASAGREMSLASDYDSPTCCFYDLSSLKTDVRRQWPTPRVMEHTPLIWGAVPPLM